MKKYILTLSNESETLLLGESLAKCCIEGCIIYLSGFIGTGKSVLCKGFLRALGYTDHIKSPTYTLIESYLLSNKRTVHHFDFYRLIGKEEEFMNIGIRDYFDGRSICLIEWSDRGINIIPKSDILITINYDNRDENFRTVILEFFSQVGRTIISNLLDFRIFPYAVKS